MTRSSKIPFLLALTLLFVASLQNNTHKYSEKSFPLTLLQISTTSPAFEAMIATRKQSAFNYPDPLPFQSTWMVLVASLPIGTPSQLIPMVLDTGSQLSWMSCNDETTNPKAASFQPNLSTTFSYLPCTLSNTNTNTNNKKKKKPEGLYGCPPSNNTLAPTCDSTNRCVYSHLYADGAFSGGNFVTEIFTFPSQPTPPLILGCASIGAAGGVLGMNLEPLSFISQLKVKAFSYCVPKHAYNSKNNTLGRLYLGPNPNSRFQYVDILPSNLLLYSVPLVSIAFGRNSVAVPPVSPSGAGQTIIDSATQFTYLVREVYNSVAGLVSRLADSKPPNRNYGFPLCFGDTSANIGNKVGDMSFVFQKLPRNVSVVISKENLFVDVRSGVCCFTILSSGVFGNTSSNIIGNIHLQNLWVQYDPKKKRVGFGSTQDCNN